MDAVLTTAACANLSLSNLNSSYFDDSQCAVRDLFHQDTSRYPFTGLALKQGLDPINSFSPNVLNDHHNDFCEEKGLFQPIFFALEVVVVFASLL